MATKRVKVVNPAETLLLVNGGKKRMAVRRRKTTVVNRRRRRTTTATNPRRRRRTNSTYIAKARRVIAPNRRRRRNPSASGVVKGALWGAAGVFVNNIIAGFIPIQASGLAGIGVKFGTAYLTGMLAEKFVPRADANAMAIGAGIGAASELINYLMGSVSGLTGQLAAKAGLSGINLGDFGMGDISPVPDYYAANTSYPYGAIGSGGAVVPAEALADISYQYH